MGKERLRGATQKDFNNPTYNAYPCKGGTWMQLLGLDSERHFPGILAAVDPEGQITSKDPFRGDNKTLIRRIMTNGNVRRQFILELGEAFLTRTAAEWEPILREKNVWHHTVSDVNDVINDAQANAGDVRGHWRSTSDPEPPHQVE